jgi:hypothetical protein
MRGKTKPKLDLTDKDSDPFLGMVKMVFETNKRYPATQFRLGDKLENQSRNNGSLQFFFEVMFK